ncbi:sialoadhesin-like [Haliotis rubra]|uniref:sialoadhesin-like n=1 Tax=Haliotis rubra TaxID=36100 RepID=UPI001EE59B7A|nr:sialoadhesin-like [Haliotis rubra]
MMQRRGVTALILMMGLLMQADALPRVSEPRLRRTRYIHQGHDVILMCLAKGIQIFRFTWMKYGQRMHVSTGHFGRLTIENFTLRDQGHYTCRVDDDEGYDVSPAVSLVLAQIDDQWNVAVRIKMTHDMSPMSLTCDHPPFCVPTGKYDWYRIEGETPSQVKTSNNIMIDNNGTLHFAFAEKKDSGIYRCGIHNTVLGVTKLGSEVNVTVQAKPNVRRFINLNGGLRPRLMSYSAETSVVLGKRSQVGMHFQRDARPYSYLDTYWSKHQSGS